MKWKATLLKEETAAFENERKQLVKEMALMDLELQELEEGGY